MAEFKVADKVLAKCEEDFLEAEIISIEGEEFKVKFTKDEKEATVSKDDIKAFEESVGEVTKFKVGDKVEAVYEDGQYYVAEVLAVEENGYKINYVEYSEEASVAFADVKAVSIEAKTEEAEVKTEEVADATPSKSVDDMVVGDDCQALYADDGNYYIAKIIEIDGDNYKINYTEYDEEATVTKDKLKPLEAGAAVVAAVVADEGDWKVGDKVLAKYADDGEFYAAEITGIEGEDFKVNYTEYGEDGTVKKEDLKKLVIAKWKVGDKCEALYTDGEYYSAEVKKVEGDSITVNYTEYGEDAVVDVVSVRVPIKSWNVGDKCEALYSDGEFYAAEVKKDEGDGKYLILYTEYGEEVVVEAKDMRVSSAAAATTTSTEASSGGADAWGSSGAADAWGSGGDSTDASSNPYGSSDAASNPYGGGDSGSSSYGGGSSSYGGGSSSYGGGSSSSGDKDPTKKLFVGRLSYNATEDQVREAFSKWGEISFIRVATDRDTGKPRGFAHVEFADLECAIKAKEEGAGLEIDGRPVNLDYTTPRREGGGGGGGSGGYGGGGGGRKSYGDRDGGSSYGDNKKSYGDNSSSSYGGGSSYGDNKSSSYGGGSSYGDNKSSYGGGQSGGYGQQQSGGYGQQQSGGYGQQQSSYGQQQSGGYGQQTPQLTPQPDFNAPPINKDYISDAPLNPNRKVNSMGNSLIITRMVNH